jgi:hypothetical protein
MMKRLALAGVAALIGTAALVLSATSVQAADFSVNVNPANNPSLENPLDRPIGSTTVLGSFGTQGFAGQTCSVVANGANNTSTHSNNNLNVVSATAVTLFDVEATPGKITTTSDQITLNDTVTVSVTIGNADSGRDGGVDYGYFSGEIDVEFTCTQDEPPPPTTTEPPELIDLCHSEGDGTYTFVEGLTQAQVDELHPINDPAHSNDIIGATQGDCTPEPPDDPPVVTVQANDITLCHSNGDGTSTVEGPMSQADADAHLAAHPADVWPVPEGGCAEFTFGAVGPVCIDGIPFIAYEINTELDEDTVELTFTDVNGDEVGHHPAAPLPSGTVIYPGATANPDDWPGWKLADNGNWEWDPTDAHLRLGLTLTATINPTGSTTVLYPEESDGCPDPPAGLTSGDPPAGGGGASSDSPSTGLPVTGSGSTVAMLLAALALLIGGIVLVRTARPAEQPTN